MNILIAGGTGFLGTAIAEHLESKGHHVNILSRKKEEGYLYWNPSKGELDTAGIANTEVLINLAGAPIIGKRWTKEQKELLRSSRVDGLKLLAQHKSTMPELKHVISASGISCYGFEPGSRPFEEADDFGSDFTSKLVKDWEMAIEGLGKDKNLTILRLAVVFSKNEGALPKIASPVLKGFGAPLGSGNQIMQWIHLEDVCRFVDFSIENSITGTYNVLSDNTTNKELTSSLAEALNKKLWLPAVPAFVIRMMLGESADLVLKGVGVSNKKMLSTSFELKYPTLRSALENIYSTEGRWQD